MISISISFKVALKQNYYLTPTLAAGPLRSHTNKIDFVRKRISGSAARFFVINLKFILTLIFDIKSHEKKNSLTTKKLIFEARFLEYVIYNIYKEARFSKYVIYNIYKDRI